MSVVGIDFGDESCYVAVARAGGIETVDNDYSLRATPSFVAFGGKQRVLGVAAKNQHITNLTNTVYGFKRLIGRKFNDPLMNPEEASRFPFTLSPTKNGGIGVKVNYLGEDQVFSAEQITAMLFSKLKETTEVGVQTTIHDCVISCPSFFSNAERQALLDAAAMAGLHVLRLFNDTTATALSYGIYKQDLPAEGEPARHVIFVDCGHSALQVFACAFNKGKLTMIANAFDATLGGRDFSSVIATHFCKEFSTRYGIDPRTNHRAYIRLLTEVDKLKKQMSANSTKLPFNIECLMNDKDVSSSMTRAIFEELAAPLFQRVEQCLRACQTASGLKPDDIYAVEIVGGASRTPAIKSLIEKVFGKTPSTTLNQDESVARGCALMCAIISPAFKVREFSVTDVQQYPVKIIFDESASGKGEMEVFPQFHPIPFSKMLTFYRRDPFTLKAAYSTDAPFLNKEIGTYAINDVKGESENIKVKVKANVNIHGIFNIPSANAYDKEIPQVEPMEDTPVSPAAPEVQAEPEAQPQPGDSEQGDAGAVPQENNGSAQNSKEGGAEEVDKKKAKKQQFKVIELPIQARAHGFSRAELDNLIETEVNLVAQDRLEKQRIDARNGLEEYVYDMRDKLDGALKEFVKDNERTQMINTLNQQEEWLYEDGTDEKKAVYLERLENLKKFGEPIKARKREFDEIPSAIENLSVVISRARKVVDAVKNNDALYDHLDAEEVKKLVHEVDNTSAWMDKAYGQLQSARKDAPLPIPLNEIVQKKDTFQTAISPIVNKSKPKVEPPPPKEEPMDTKDATNGASKDSKSPKNAKGKHEQPTSGAEDQPQNDNSMEVD